MDIAKLKSLIDLVSRSHVSELELVEGDERVRIVKAASNPQPQARSQTPAAGPAATAALPTIEARTPTPPGERAILSPMYGVFYRAPSPDSLPFVELGQKIQKGEKLCVIEAMKLFNVVEAELDGTVEAILVENGQEVEVDQPLFHIA